MVELLEVKKSAREVARERLESGLPYFTGSESWHRHGLGGKATILLTDGVKFVADVAGAYWLMDMLLSYKPRLDKFGNFWLIRLDVQYRDGERWGVFTARQDNDAPIEVKQEFEYTDFPLDSFEFYYIDGVALLKSEY